MFSRSVLQALLRGAIRLARQAPEVPDAELAPCHVGVVFATALEAAAMEGLLSGLIAIRAPGFDARQGGLKGRSVIVVRGGVGRASAAQATAALIAGHRPRWVISAGLAGGLDPSLKREDLVIPHAVVGEDGSRIDVTPPQLSAYGSVITVHRVVLRVADKRALRERHGAACVDMETLGVAEACREAGQPFFAVRVISDTADQELPAEVERLLKKKTRARQLGAAAGSIVRRPGMVKDLWRLQEAALVSSEKLAKFLADLIGRL